MRSIVEITPYYPDEVDEFDLGVFEIPRLEQLLVIGLNSFAASQKVVNAQGTKTETFQYQLRSEASAQPANESESNKLENPLSSGTVDEDTVNSALLSLLRALVAKFPRLTCRWMTHQKCLKANFKQGSYITCVDGYLQSKITGNTLVLIEVKATKRNTNEPEVSMQEAAQMVAWLKMDKKLMDTPARDQLVEYNPAYGLKF